MRRLILSVFLGAVGCGGMPVGEGNLDSGAACVQVAACVKTQIGFQCDYASGKVCAVCADGTEQCVVPNKGFPPDMSNGCLQPCPANDVCVVPATNCMVDTCADAFTVVCVPK